MTPSSPPLADPRATAIRSFSFSLGYLQFLLLCLVGAAVAGQAGMVGTLDPVLLDPKVNTLVLLLLSLHVVVSIARGTFQTGRDGQMLGAEWASIWTPLSVTLIAGLLVPVHGGVSPLMLSLSWVMNAVGGL